MYHRNVHSQEGKGGGRRNKKGGARLSVSIQKKKGVDPICRIRFQGVLIEKGRRERKKGVCPSEKEKRREIGTDLKSACCEEERGGSFLSGK